MPSRLKVLHRIFPLSAATLLIAGCQSLVPDPRVFSPDDDPLRSAPPITRGLDAEGLSTLLGAELAGQRGDYDHASRGYLKASQRYADVGLAERATLAARFGNNPRLLEEAILRWREMAPHDETPLRLLAALSLQRGDWRESLQQRLAIAERGGNGDVTSLAEMALAQEVDPRPLLEMLQEYLAQPDVSSSTHHSDVLLATALLEAAIGETASAVRRLDQVAAQAPDQPALWLTRARLALEMQDANTARQAAQRGLALAPEDIRFMLLLAQAEIRLGNLKAAEAQTDTMLASHIGGHDLRLALAQLYLEEGHTAPAQRLLQPLLEEESTPPLGFYLLGVIAQAEGDIDDALLFYRQVGSGNEFLPARATAARMLIENDRLLDARAFLRIERMRFDEHFSDLVMLEVRLLDELDMQETADSLLDRELGRTPDDVALLYMRAMRRWEAGNLEGMEQDLRRIIANDPDNAMALNALGYTLIDHQVPGRQDEALEMLERAYELEPENPAVLDSLGWAHYRRGDPEQALPWLERAYARMPDQEIAGHLAEVLHALGRTEQARGIIRQALERFEQHPVIDRLLERYPQLAPVDD
ncbi:tetratricopeptide repeat protein [Halomonas sp. Bachu 37]|uniref:tetratricopeptide repeat protein n=1 Tax=Halomonas kashgarensis TaxID=3084920 RepID=UPI003217C79C